MADLLGLWVDSIITNKLKLQRVGAAVPIKAHDPEDELLKVALNDIPLAVLVSRSYLSSGRKYGWFTLGDYRFLAGDWLMMRPDVKDGFVFKTSPYSMIGTGVEGANRLNVQSDSVVDFEDMKNWLKSHRLVAIRPVVINVKTGEQIVNWPTKRQRDIKYVHTIEPQSAAIDTKNACEDELKCIKAELSKFLEEAAAVSTNDVTATADKGRIRELEAANTRLEVELQDLQRKIPEIVKKAQAAATPPDSSPVFSGLSPEQITELKGTILGRSC